MVLSILGIFLPVSNKGKGKVVYNPLRLGTVIVLVSSGINFVNTPCLTEPPDNRDCQFALMVCTRGSPKKHTTTQLVMPEMRLECLNVCLTDRRLNQLS